MTANIKKSKKTNWRKVGFLCILLFPALSHLAIFWFGVQIENFRLAFTNPNTEEFTFSNFKYVTDALFGVGDPFLKESFGNTMVFFAISVAMIPLGMFVAYLLYRRMIFHTFTKLVLYLPSAISGIMMGILYQQLMKSDGPIFSTELFQKLLEGNSFLTEHALLYIIIFDVWVGIGGNLILWLGTMNRIPDSLLESARLDGITPIKEFTRIVLPLCWPTFVTMLTLAIIGIFGASGSVLLLTEGKYGTFTINFWLYYIVLSGQTDQYNYSAATGLFFTLLTVPLVFAGRKFMNKFGEAVEY